MRGPVEGPRLFSKFSLGHGCTLGTCRATLARNAFAGVWHLRTLWLMRHGNAVAAGANRDDERPLSMEGRLQAQCAGRAMDRAGFQPEAIWHSPYLRAAQTAESIAAFFPKAPCYVNAGWVPHGRAADLVDELLQQAPDRLLVVSHLPLLPEVLSELLKLPRGLDFSTASLAHCVLPATRAAHYPGALVGFYPGEALRRWGDADREDGDDA